MQLQKYLIQSTIIILTAFFLVACGSDSSANNSSDTIAPVITLNGLSNIHIIQGGNYTEAGATAVDNIDGNLTSDIVIAGDTVDTNTPFGTTFTITYNVFDTAGNGAIEAIRTVSIIKESNTQHIIPIISETDKANYLFLINEARSVARTCGDKGSFPAVDPVTWSNKLYNAAFEHSQDLAKSNTFSHDGSGTVTDWSGYALNKASTMRDRVATYDYQWSWISENISAGTQRDTPKEAIDSWITSPGHCKNLMDPNMTQVGMAVVKDTSSKYTHYWTQNFGVPR
jgi:uncharacterized protein YkwD